MKMKFCIFALLILIFSMLLYFAFRMGIEKQKKIQQSEIAKIQAQHTVEVTNFQDYVIDLNEQIDAWSRDLALENETKTYNYQREILGIHSPLFEGKQIVETSYHYKNEEILRKRIVLDAASSVDIWEFQNRVTVPEGQIPPDFVIASDNIKAFSNRRLREVSKLPELLNKDEGTYITKNNLVMNYYSEYAGRQQVGRVNLNYYTSAFSYRSARPSLIMVWNKNNKFLDSKSGLSLPEVKKEVSKIADTINIITP